MAKKYDLWAIQEKRGGDWQTLPVIYHRKWQAIVNYETQYGPLTSDEKSARCVPCRIEIDPKYGGE